MDARREGVLFLVFLILLTSAPAAGALLLELGKAGFPDLRMGLAKCSTFLQSGESFVPLRGLRLTCWRDWSELM